MAAAALAAIVFFFTACGGDDSTSTTTAGQTTGAATKTVAAATATTSASGTPASAAALAEDVATLRAVMQDTIAKAQAGDLQGTRDAESKGDDAIEAIIKAVKPVDPSLADAIEKLELDYEAQADATTTDLTVIAKDAQAVLPLLDQVVTTLKLPSASAAAEGTPVSKAQLASYFTEIKAVLADTIAKAQAGDVQGTRDAEGKGDEAMEAIIKSVRLVDPALADSIEKLELDYEAQADSTTTDLSVIAKDAQDALPLLEQAAVKLGITP